MEDKSIDMGFLVHNLFCSDDIDTKNITGSEKSARTSNIVVFFERCDKEKRISCKSDEEFDEWITSISVVFFLNNQDFQVKEFGENKIKQIARDYNFWLGKVP